MLYERLGSSVRMVAVCCDGSRAEGLGHVNRCLGLAEALADAGWNAAFLGHFDDFAVTLILAAGFEATRLPDEGGSRLTARDVVSFARACGSNLTILDSYHLDAADVEAVGAARIKVALVDDFSGWPRYPAAYVLNFAIDASANAYPADAGVRYLLGPRFFPARKHLRAARMAHGRRPVSSVQRICVAISSDPDARLTGLVLECVKRIAPASDVRVILSRRPENSAAFENKVQGFGSESCVRYGLKDISGELLASDAVICSGGLVKYEAGYLGASGLVISHSEKEARDTSAWVARGAAIDLGPAGALEGKTFRDKLASSLGSAATVAAIGEAARGLFSPDGAKLAVEIMTQT